MSAKTATIPLEPTGKARRHIGIVTPLDDIELDYAVIEGANSGKRLLVTAGIHGAEFCAIETARRLMELSEDRINGTLVVIPLVNVQAFRQHRAFVMPEDGKNLNRQFPGKADGTVSERLAHWLTTEIYPNFDAYLDLHSGDLPEALTPFTNYLGSDGSRKLAEVFGLPFAVRAQGKAGAINGAELAGVPAIGVEVGSGGRWTEAEVALANAGIARVMRYLGMFVSAGGAFVQNWTAPEYPWARNASFLVSSAPQSKKAVFVAGKTLAAEHDGFWYPVKIPGDTISAGEVLGRVQDIHGSCLQTVSSDAGGFYLYGLVALSVTQGATVAYVGIP
jgi:uncharacterized protein